MEGIYEYLSSVAEFTKGVNDYISFYNSKRPHRTLNFKSPEQIEEIDAIQAIPEWLPEHLCSETSYFQIKYLVYSFPQKRVQFSVHSRNQKHLIVGAFLHIRVGSRSGQSKRLVRIYKLYSNKRDISVQISKLFWSAVGNESAALRCVFSQFLLIMIYWNFDLSLELFR